MPYYHVLLETQKETFCEADHESLEKIIKNIVKPYVQKECPRIDGYEIQRNEVRRIVIKESNASAKELAALKNARIDRLNRTSDVFVIGPGYNAKDIVKSDIQDLTVITDNVIDSVKEELASHPQTTSPQTGLENKKTDKNKVFIVHGRDKAAKESVARLIEKFGLEAIILAEQPNSGSTIIEKIEKNTDVGFGIVIYTPCDLGRLNEYGSEERPRARQNVVLEHGYLMGKIGRKNVCALKSPEVETPNDISGIVYIPLDEAEAWHHKLAKELHAAGYKINAEALLQ